MHIGDWVRVSILGSGGFGIVSLWRNEKIDEHIAVKMCKSKLPSSLSKRQRERWMEEVQFMRKINNANIVSFKTLPPILDAMLNKYNTSNLPILSMEYCSKGNLRHFLNQYEHFTGVKELDVRYILRDLLNAVSHLHELNITHRDLKPENIVLDKCDSRPNKIIYKLIDLGYAKELDSAGASFVGTLQYLAPEIFYTESKYDCSVDYWSFGIVTYEVICGTHPFLPHLPPAERFKYIEKKSPLDICIYKSRSGEFKYTPEIIFEHSISPCFKHHLELWLRQVLQFDPKKRNCQGSGASSPAFNKLSNSSVFADLYRILNVIVLRVFSVYNYQFYYYEVDSKTLVSSVQLWLEKDTGISVREQMLLSEVVYYSEDKGDRCLGDCFDGLSSQSLLILYRKHSPLAPIRIQLPRTIARMYEAPTTPHPRETARALYAQGAHYIAHELERLESFSDAFRTHSDYVLNLFEFEARLYTEVKEKMSKVLVQIDVYTDLNERMRGPFHTDRTTDSLLEHARVWRVQMQKCKELVDIVNGLSARHCVLQARKARLITATEELKVSLQGDKIANVYSKMKTDWSQIYEQKPNVTCAPILKCINVCIKIVKETTQHTTVINYLSISWRLHREISRLVRWMESLRSEVDALTEQICQNECSILPLLGGEHANSTQYHQHHVHRERGFNPSGSNALSSGGAPQNKFSPAETLAGALSLEDTESLLDEASKLISENRSIRCKFHNELVNGMYQLRLLNDNENS